MFGFDLMVLMRNVFRGGHTQRNRRVANTRLLPAREAAVQTSLHPPFPVTTAKYPRAFIGKSLPSKMESIWCVCVCVCVRKGEGVYVCGQGGGGGGGCVCVQTRSCFIPPSSARSTLVNTKTVRCPGEGSGSLIH